MTFDPAQLAALAPLIVLTVVGCFVLLAETFAKGASRAGLAHVSIGGCVIAAGAVLYAWGDAATPQTTFSGMWTTDRLALFLDFTFLATAALTLLFAGPYMREHGFESGESYALILFGTAGMMMTAHASHLLSLLIGIETMSLAAYVLTGCWRREPRSSEGALKYFLMGAFATSFLVYGMALVYGMTGGALTYDAIAAKTAEAAKQPLFVVGVLFILIALVFKIAAVPFHMWAPDAYEGAPTPMTGFMAAGVKAAAFGAIVRLVDVVLDAPQLTSDAHSWVSIVATLAAITMTFGNLAALRQENVKRMLAYSSIAHAGYLMIGLVAMGLALPEARAALLFYLAAYTVTTLGAFGAVAWVGRRGDERLYIDDWGGLGAERPGLALAMTIFLLSLGGVPPTAGFFGKFYLFRAAIESPQLVWLVVLGALNSALSVYYYLRVVVAMYFRDPMGVPAAFPSAAMRAGLVIAALAVVALGVAPGSVLEWAAGKAAEAAVAAVSP